MWSAQFFGSFQTETFDRLLCLKTFRHTKRRTFQTIRWPDHPECHWFLGSHTNQIAPTLFMTFFACLDKTLQENSLWLTKKEFQDLLSQEKRARLVFFFNLYENWVAAHKIRFALNHIVTDVKIAAPRDQMSCFRCLILSSCGLHNQKLWFCECWQFQLSILLLENSEMHRCAEVVTDIFTPWRRWSANSKVCGLIFLEDNILPFETDRLVVLGPHMKKVLFSLFSTSFQKVIRSGEQQRKQKQARKLANRYQECFTKFCNDCFGEKRKKLNFSGQKMADSVSCATFAFFCDKNQIVPKSSANPQTRTAKSASATSENLSTMRVPPWCREEVVFCSCAVMGSTSSRFGAWQIISHLFLVIPAGETSKSKSGAFDFVPASSMHVCPIFFNGVLTLKVNRLRAFKGLAPPCSLFWGKYVDGIVFPFSDRESTALFPVVFSSMGKQLWPYELSAQE